MTQRLHLGDEVRILTDRFREEGIHQGSIGVIVDDWADGSNTVEVRDRDSGDVVGRVQANADEVELYTGSIEVKQPREHGILFGRGDALPSDVEEPPTGLGPITYPVAGWSPAPIAFYNPPPEPVTVEGDVPWELQDEPPAS